MSDHDDDARPRPRRRKQVAIGAVGLTALLGVGAYIVTAQVVGDHHTTAQETGAQVPPAVSSAGPAGAAPKKMGGGGAEVTPGPAPSRSLTIEQQIRAAREKAAKDGFPIKRPVTARPGFTPASGPVSEHDENTRNGSLHIITAKHDLTGQGQLLWAGDNGKPVGDDRCTKNFRFSNNTKASVRPTMLMCWRTSATRSVVTVLIDFSGKPSVEKSTAIIAREWAKLG